MTVNSPMLPSGHSLRMREPAELAGAWTIAVADRVCRVSFAAERLEPANAWRLDDPDGCLAALLPGAAGWRPVPEGVAIAAADRRTLAVFAITGDAAAGEATLPAGRVTLRRG